MVTISCNACKTAVETPSYKTIQQVLVEEGFIKIDLAHGREVHLCMECTYKALVLLKVLDS